MSTSVGDTMSDDALWHYNCLDTVYTREVGEVLRITAEAMKLDHVDDTQQKLFKPVLAAMIRGVKIRHEVKNQMALDIQEELSKRESFLHNILGHSINPSSPKQMQTLFYDDIKQPVI